MTKEQLLKMRTRICCKICKIFNWTESEKVERWIYAEEQVNCNEQTRTVKTERSARDLTDIIYKCKRCKRILKRINIENVPSGYKELMKEIKKEQ